MIVRLEDGGGGEGEEIIRAASVGQRTRGDRWCGVRVVVMVVLVVMMVTVVVVVVLVVMVVPLRQEKSMG